MAVPPPARLRRGLPRVPGGTPWPDVPESVLAALAPETQLAAEPESAAVAEPENAAVASLPAAEIISESGASSSPVRIRQGLPRVPGGAPWPDVSDSALASLASEVVPETVPEVVAAESLADSGAPIVSTAASVRIRRGLPRVAGGAPWPEVDEAALLPAPTVPVATVPASAASSVVAAEPAPAASISVATTASPAQGAVGVPVRIRKGLPRVAGGPRWPDIDSASLPVTATVSPAPPVEAPTSEVATPTVSAEEPITPKATPAAPKATPAPNVTPTTPKAAPVAPKATPVAATATTAPPKAAPAPAKAPVAPARTAAAAKPAAAAKTAAKAASSSDTKKKKYHGFTIPQWVGVGIGLVVVVVVGSLAVRGLLTFQWAHDFVTTYPGDYPLPAWAPTGQPLWLEWQHFFNIFFMLLIIRTGIQVRREVKPKASWMPKWDNKRRISLTVWTHQSLDLLWFLNGLVFWVALFATGQWVKLVPTSWAVFPNAISAGLKYATFTMPPGDGWANYNSLQQLTYFVIVFLLAPVSVLTGLRMSGLWPKKVEWLNKLYPAPVARAIHFPAMICFVVFVCIHVVLVFATGALENLNHMFGHRDVVSWFGCGIFAIAVLIFAAAWVALRPLIIAPIASLFGKVGR